MFKRIKEKLHRILELQGLKGYKGVKMVKGIVWGVTRVKKG